MGEVAVLFRLMPKEVSTDLKAVAEGVRTGVPGAVKVRGMQVKEIAYGLKALLVSVVMADSGGVLDATEESLRRIPGVESVEVMEEGLL